MSESKNSYDLYDCFYWNKSPDFQRPPLKNIGRTVTTDNHAAAVVVPNEQNMAEKNRLNIPDELKGKKFRIRKLTPRECFRLMGVDDADIDKIQAYPYESLIEHPAYSKAERFAGITEKEKRAAMKLSISDSAQYKLAGNSIVVDVLYHIFRKMFIETGRDHTDKEIQLELF